MGVYLIRKTVLCQNLVTFLLYPSLTNNKPLTHESIFFLVVINPTIIMKELRICSFFIRGLGKPTWLAGSCELRHGHP